MSEILLTFTGLALQKGAAAQVVSLVAQIREIRPDVHLTLLSHYSDLDAPWAAKLGIRVRRIPAYARCHVEFTKRPDAGAPVGIVGVGLARRAGLATSETPTEVVSAAYRRADLVLDLSGDSYRDPPGGRSIAHNVNLLACQAVGVPYALVSQSLGPFDRWNRCITRYCLNHARLIYVRELNTLRLLSRMGVRSSLLHLAPDLAYTLPSAPAAEVDRIICAEWSDLAWLPRPWVGISTSDLLFTRLSRSARTSTIRELSGLALHINRTLSASVILVPHYRVPEQLGTDDVSAADLIAAQLGRPPWLVVCRGDYGPSEIKGLIARFDAFVACRMHAGIAALSSNVPTLMVAWSSKYDGLMEEMGLRQFVWNVVGSAPNSLAHLFDRLWQQRDFVQEHLRAVNATTGVAVRKAVERIFTHI